MMLPSFSIHHFKGHERQKVFNGLDKHIDLLAGKIKRRGTLLSAFSQQASEIQSLIDQYSLLGTEEISHSLVALSPHFIKPNPPRSVVNRAIALLGAASLKILALRPHTEQIIAILGLQNGYILEMDTGEGKTLVSGLASILLAWRKRPCHVLTVNDYLATRDKAFLSPLTDFLGISCGIVISEDSTEQRRQQYACEIVYTTSQELLADFLRDRILLRRGDSHAYHILGQISGYQPALVTRGISSVIVDEVDSILIDQAVSPLIIAAPGENKFLETLVSEANDIVRYLEKHTHYRVFTKQKYIQLNNSGIDKILNVTAEMAGLWQNSRKAIELVEQAIKAKELYIRDKDYIVEDNKVIIVDEFTGRKMPDRSWSLGLHQAVEAKESVTITPPNETQERMSYQKFFRLFDHTCGVSGTVNEVANELWHIYRLPVLKIPRHKACQRTIHTEKVFKTKAEKWCFLVELIEQTLNKQQPLLIGTRTIDDSEQIARLLEAKGLPYQLLNARYSEEEADIISKAGSCGRITIATNMAGRGTDIKLDTVSFDNGGLFVILTEFHDSPRIDRQLAGRCARQGDPGCYLAISSFEDELIQQAIPTYIRRILYSCLNSSIGQKAALMLFARAQRKAEKQAYRQRQSVLSHDLQMKSSLSFNAEY
ncbi:helicase-related protein [Endozoicomonas atrinae]|uniref:preprotein translocase subunit SecA n=1 Tax=Endozoicomonas atrinae TaxID=1333660 RepID=UPI0008244D50|nr:helicase-related protein [Endozoicomonas atrinae]